MKKRIFAGFMALLMFSLGAVGQSKDEKAITDAVEIFRKGMMTADRNLLDMITAEELVYGHSSGKVQNKQEFIDEVVSHNPLTYETVDLTEQTIKIAGKTAIVRHTFTSQTKSPTGVAGKVFIGNMLVWQKQHGKWKLLARQAYKK